MVKIGLLLLDVLQAVEHNGNQNDDAGEDELQVGVNAQSGQGVGQSGEDEDADHNAGDLT